MSDSKAAVISQENIEATEGAVAENGALTDTQAGATQQARDIERVTDYAEDVEVDAAKLGSAMTLLTNARDKDEKAQAEADALITIRKEDVDLMVQEMGVTRARAEKTLRSNNGRVLDALKALILDPVY